MGNSDSFRLSGLDYDILYVDLGTKIQFCSVYEVYENHSSGTKLGICYQCDDGKWGFVSSDKFKSEGYSTRREAGKELLVRKLINNDRKESDYLW